MSERPSKLAAAGMPASSSRVGAMSRLRTCVAILTGSAGKGKRSTNGTQTTGVNTLRA